MEQSIFSKIGVLWAILLLVLVTHLNASDVEPPTIKKAFDFRHENPDKALSFAREALDYGLSSGNSLHIAKAYRSLGLVYLAMNHNANAREHLDSALKYAQIARDPQENLELLKAQVWLLQAEGKPREAREVIRNGIKSLKREGETPIEIQLLLFAGDYYRQMSRFDESIRQKQAALNMARSIDVKALVAQCLHSLGSTYWQQSAFEQALENYTEAQRIRAELNDTIGLITTHNGLAIAYRDMGRFLEANGELANALNLASAIKDTSTTASVLNLLGSIAFRTGAYAEALDYYQKSIEIRRGLGYLSSAASSLENLARVYRETNRFDESQDNLSEAIAIFERLGSSRQVASAYNEKGNLYSQQGLLAEALKFYLLSLKLRQEIGENQDIARSLTNIGLTYRKIGSMNNALRYFEQAIELVPETMDPVVAAYIHVHIGNTKRDLGIPEGAIQSFMKALHLRRSTGNQQLIAQALRSLSLAYSDLNDFERADSYLNSALEIYQNNNERRGIADIHNELGNLSQLQGEHYDAIEHFKVAVSLYSELGDRDREGLCHRKIGEIQTQLEMYPEAYANLSMALDLGKESNNAKLVELTLLAFHTYYSMQGEYREALEFFSQHVVIRDSILEKRQEEMIWQASMELELSKKLDEIQRIEGEIELLRTEARLKGLELEKQRIIRNFLATVTLLVIIIAVGSIYAYIAMKRAHAKLAESERSLRTTVRTKDKLFSIIAHDLRSPFTALSGLTEVLACRAKGMSGEEVEEYGQLIHESSEKLLSLIDALLLWSRSQTGKIKLKPQRIPVRELASETFRHLDLQASTKGLNLVNDSCPESVIHADYDTMLAVIRNLVSNAIKFTGSGGTITISSEQDGDSTLIRITDTGVGIPPDVIPKLFSLDENVSTKGTNQEAGTGLGLIVCKEFVERNGGNLSVQSVPGEGTTFTVRVGKG